MTMLRLDKVNGGNIWDILDLRVRDDQRNFVAANDISIIEAYATISSGGYAFPFGIYNDDTPVGFLMIGFDSDEHWVDAPSIAKGNYSIWRFMIDQRYQHSGYGKAALLLALEFVRSFPCGPAEFCWLSYEPENSVAKHLYQSAGFAETGEFDQNECIATLKL